MTGWTAAEVARELGLEGGAASARSWLRRQGVKALAERGGFRGDAKLYDPDEVRKALSRMPGHGRWGPRK